METERDLLTLNRQAWTHEVEIGNIWTLPVDEKLIAEARSGTVQLLLTPSKHVPMSWYPPLAGAQVLCLASAGGQQAPLLAAAGAIVTVIDNCPAQLEKDAMVAARENLTDLTIEQGDMRDLSRYADSSFDLIFHPVSNCFVDDVRVVWRECARVLRSGGVLLAGFANPLIYIFDMDDWDEGKLTPRYKIPYSDLRDLPKDRLEKRIAAKETLEFGHTLTDQIGGQLDAGLVMTGFFEDSANGDLLDPYIETFIATRCVKP